MNSHPERRTTFDNNAKTYRLIRPTYPEALFEDLVTSAKLKAGAHLLEIGPGTGQATLPLAKRGYSITAIELGEELAEEARDYLKDFKKVKILTGAFEEIELPSESFNLIYSATAFHWIKPELQFTKTHQLLKLDGCLAIIHTNHVSDKEGDAYFHATQSIYAQYDPTDDKDFRLPKIADLKPTLFNESLFTPILFKTYPLAVRYTAKEYVDLLSTYSPTLAMPAEIRTKFLDAIEDVINQQFNGSILKHFAMSLSIAQRKDV